MLIILHKYGLFCSLCKEIIESVSLHRNWHTFFGGKPTLFVSMATCYLYLKTNNFEEKISKVTLYHLKIGHVQ